MTNHSTLEILLCLLKIKNDSLVGSAFFDSWYLFHLFTDSVFGDDNLQIQSADNQQNSYIYKKYADAINVNFKSKNTYINKIS